jgi:hypothetical protein
VASERGLAAYSCGHSRGIGPSPAPHSLLIPAGNRRPNRKVATIEGQSQQDSKAVSGYLSANLKTRHNKKQKPQRYLPKGNGEPFALAVRSGSQTPHLPARQLVRFSSYQRPNEATGP